MCPGGHQCSSAPSLCMAGNATCADGSDQDPSFCTSYKCPLGSLKCGSESNTTCSSGYKCDGSSDCADGSDEEPSFCLTFDCPAGYVKCKDGLQCVFESSMCDGYPSCKGRQSGCPAQCARCRV